MPYAIDNVQLAAPFDVFLPNVFSYKKKLEYPFTDSMHNSSSVSINVSDDYADEPSGKSRARVRRKLKKFEHRGKTEFTREVIKRLLRWWPYLLFFTAVALLLFEISRLSWRTSSPVENSVHVAEKKPPANLNRLDPTTRVAHGVRERSALNLGSFFELRFFCIALVLMLKIV